MSNAVLPSLAGLKYPAKRKPIWSGKVQTAVSGKETRLSYWSYPRYQWTIGYEVLRSAGGFTDLQQLIGFYNARQAQFDDWLWTDPDDSSVTRQPLGTGDGSTVSFQFTRTIGGYTEPVTAVNVVTSVSRTDWQGATELSGNAHPNYVLFSEQFDNAAWAKIGTLTVVPDTITAPDGTFTGDTLNTPAVSDATSQLVGAVAVGNSYVFSVWLTGVAGSTINLEVGNTAGTIYNGAVAVVLTATFARYSVTFSSGVGATGNIFVAIARRAGQTSTALKIWGAQFEYGVAPTSYVRTGASASLSPDVVISNTGNVTFSVPPVAGAVLTWSGSYYWRVRFDDIDLTLEKLMGGLWSSGDISFTSVK